MQGRKSIDFRPYLIQIMKEKIVGYRKKIDEVIENPNDIDVDEIISVHLEYISFFQHERLIHLIVTVLFALMCMILLCANLIISNLFLFILEVLVIILLVPYVFHYYTLENETQKMYDQYDKLIEIKKSKN